MALRKLRYDGDDILRKKAKPVKDFNRKLHELIEDMMETMADCDGVGLAAPQIGVLKRVVVIDVGEGPFELVNPVIVGTEGTQEKKEGCLSIPGQSGIVARPAKTVVKAKNRFGEEITVTGEEVLSVALNHELDHLDGILYIDKVLRMCGDEQEEDEQENDVEKETDADK